MRLWVPILLLLLLVALVWIVIRGLIDLVAWFREEFIEDWRTPAGKDQQPKTDQADELEQE